MQGYHPSDAQEAVTRAASRGYCATTRRGPYESTRMVYCGIYEWVEEGDKVVTKEQ